MGTQKSTSTVGVNQSLVLGELRTESEQRLLPSGTVAMSFALTVRVPGEPTTSVPMVWYDPPQRAQQWKVGDQIVAVGVVTRRFFRGGGGLGSSTEVVVSRAQNRRHENKVASMVSAWRSSIDTICGEQFTP